MKRVVAGARIRLGALELAPGGDDRFALAHVRKPRAAVHGHEAKLLTHSLDAFARDPEELAQQRTRCTVTHEILEERLLGVLARGGLETPGDLVAVVVHD